jgi:hypothetical protein
MFGSTTRRIALLALAGTLSACGSGAGPSTGTQVVFSVGTRAASPGHLSMLSQTFTVGNDVLVLDSVKLVLRDVRFKRVEDSACPDDGATPSGSTSSHDEGEIENGDDGHADACESFNAGPYLLNLPLDGGVEQAFSVTVDTGTYDQLRVKLHAPRTDGDQKDLDFLAAHPEFSGLSIRAWGTFNGGPQFSFESSVSSRQRIAFIPPISVGDPAAPGTPQSVSVTIRIDLSGWFLDANGNLVDPATANPAGANETLVSENIQRSFHAFQDENHDCHNDHGSDDN